VVLAPAKVNLFLEVGRRRDDGFHELDTLFQAIDMWDRVELERVGAGVTLRVRGPDLGPVEDNLAVRAARLYLADVGGGGGVEIDLTKRVPAGAGLGGGSSDAAAVLRGMNELWGRPVQPGRLAELGATLGSDVAFFLGESPLARGTGRGEILEPFPVLPPADLVVVCPPVHVATRGAYQALDRRRTDAPVGPRPAARRDRPKAWTDVEAMAGNDFEEVVVAAHPEIRRSLAGLRDVGGRPALLSGSGSACFALFDDGEVARTAAAELEAKLGWPALAVRTLVEFPLPERKDLPGG